MKWHYTSLVRLKTILTSGVLLTKSYEGERPAVWFSSNQTWEATACKRINTMTRRLTFEEQVALIGCARIDIERDDLLTYAEWVKHVPQEFAMSLYFGGIELGANPGEWFASFDPVPAQDWRSVQMWKDDRWTNLEEIL